MTGKAVLAAFVTGAQKSYGKRSTGRSDVVAVPRRKVPLGPLRLDHALGGGLDMGSIHSFYGEKSGGKTTTALMAVARCQQLCRNCYRFATDIVAVPPSAEILVVDPLARWGATGKCTCFADGIYQAEVPDFTDGGGKKLAVNSGKYNAELEAWKARLTENSYEEFVCAWVDLELSFDAKYAELRGVDTKRVQLFRPETAEMTIDLMHAMTRTVEVDLVVLDSIAQMAPNKEIESSAEEWQQGLQARLVNKMCRQLAADGSMVANQGHTATQIWINQTRQKIGVMYGDPSVKPGGKGQEFAVHVEVKFLGSKRVMEEITYGAKDKGEVLDRPVSETFRFEVTKSKAGKTREVGGNYTVRLYTTDAGKAGELIEVDDVFKMAMHFIVQQDPKSKKYMVGDDEFGSQKEILAKLRDDAVFLRAVKAILLELFLAEEQKAS